MKYTPIAAATLLSLAALCSALAQEAGKDAAADAEEAKSPAAQKFEEIDTRFRMLRGPITRAVRSQDPEAEFKDKVSKPLKELLTDCNELLNSKDLPKDLTSQALSMKLSMLQIGAHFDSDGFMKTFEDAAAKIAKDNPGSQEAEQAEARLLATKMQMSDDGAKDWLPDVDAFAKTYPESAVAGQLYLILGDKLAASDKTDKAKQVYRKGLGQSAGTYLANTFAGKIQNLELVGQPMKVAGPTIEGSEMDVKSLKGKVVLVDFWATWCGPCVASMPELKKLYEEYHDKGFEVVGVSLDNGADEVKEFVKDNAIPWPQIHFEGGRNPLAEEYRVDSIPRMFLIGRDGNVVSTNIRGEKAIADALKRELAKPDKPLAN